MHLGEIALYNVINPKFYTCTVHNKFTVNLLLCLPVLVWYFYTLTCDEKKLVKFRRGDFNAAIKFDQDILAAVDQTQC